MPDIDLGGVPDTGSKSSKSCAGNSTNHSLFCTGSTVKALELGSKSVIFFCIRSTNVSLSFIGSQIQYRVITQLTKHQKYRRWFNITECFFVRALGIYMLSFIPPRKTKKNLYAMFFVVLSWTAVYKQKSQITLHYASNRGC